MAYTDIDDPSAFFNSVLWTGNGSGGRNITGVGFRPDLVWIKRRSAVENHVLNDAVRGVPKNLYSSSAQAEDTGSLMSAIISDGFTVQTDASVNVDGSTYVAWNWKAETSFSNDASSTSVGTIDSVGSVNTDAGFSIQTWTGTGSGGTIAHGLGAVPSFMIVKNRSDGGRNWPVYFGDRTKYMYLSSTDAQANAGTIIWNNTTPTSTVFSVGNDNGVNESSKNYVGYVFAEKKGFSKTGSYIGNGSVDGSFVYTGFKPAFILQKNTARAGAGWGMFDSTRTPTNVSKAMLIANSTAVEDTGNAPRVDFLSNGFKWRTTDNWFNDNGNVAIYIAFAENPFVTSTGIPATAK
jgi:hypothetical protein